jgi:hypothetical protein
MRPTPSSTILGSFIALGACAQPPKTGTAAVAQKLGLTTPTDIVGTWVGEEPADPTVPYADFDLLSDGNFTGHDNTTQPPTASSGSWGVVDHALDFIFDSSDPTTYHRTAWTYVADANRLGMGFFSDGTNVGPVGTWTGHLIDEQVSADGQPTSGRDIAITLVLASDGTATTHTTHMDPGVPPSSADANGTYSVKSDGSISVRTKSGNEGEVIDLSPVGGGYANPIYVRGS